jgi:hypothetical protein
VTYEIAGFIEGRSSLHMKQRKENEKKKKQKTKIKGRDKEVREQMRKFIFMCCQKWMMMDFNM